VTRSSSPSPTSCPTSSRSQRPSSPPHHLPARGRRWGAQLGLPLPLAPRRRHEPLRPVHPRLHRRSPRLHGVAERTTAGRAEDLQLMYGVGGERLLPELELPTLDGYRGGARQPSTLWPHPCPDSAAPARSPDPPQPVEFRRQRPGAVLQVLQVAVAVERPAVDAARPAAPIAGLRAARTGIVRRRPAAALVALVDPRSGLDADLPGPARRHQGPGLLADGARRGHALPEARPALLGLFAPYARRQDLG
jgi:hypothetical protein